VYAALMVGLLLALQAPIPLIDLVSEPSNSGKLHTFGFTKFFTDGPRPPKPKPPLALRLESVIASQADSGVRIVEVLVTNVSGEPYPVAVGRDGDAALKPGNRGRHMLWLWLRSAPRRDDPLGTLGGGDTCGSADLEGSTLMLPSGASIRVRFPVKLRLAPQALSQWKKAGVTSVEVHAALTDHYLDDFRTNPDFMVREVKADSDNTLTLRLNP